MTFLPSAMATHYQLLLFWIYLARLRIPSVFLVRPLCTAVLMEHAHAVSASMRYSRMLEESSFANRKADYFWLLLLSSTMLLVGISFFSLYHN